MNDEELEELVPVWKALESEIWAAIEAVAWRQLPKLDKLGIEVLGLRDRDPENDYDRWLAFVGFIERVYLSPSLLGRP